MNNLKYVIVGGNGFLGKKITSILTEHGNEAFSLSRNSTPKLDVSTRENIRETLDNIKPDAVVNCAAMTDIDMCEDQPEIARKINSDGVFNLADYTSKTGIRFVHISTDYVFDGIRGDYTETDFPNPINVYGKTKLEGENRAISIDPKTIVMRTSFLYGFNDEKDKVIGIRRTIENLLQNNKQEIFMDQYVSPTLIDDVACAIEKLIGLNKAGIYHVAGPERIDRYSFVQEIAKIYDVDNSLLIPISMYEINFKAKRPADSSLSPVKAQNDGIILHNAVDGIKIMHEQEKKGSR